MKKLIFVSFAIWSMCLQAQIEVKSSIQSVTIALNGAQVFRKTTINYNKGVSKVLIDNVSPSIRNVGIQASSLGNYRIMDVKHVLKYPEPNKIEASVTPAHIQKEMDQLNDSIFHAKLIEENLLLKIETIKKQIDAQKSTLVISSEGINKEILPLQVQVEQLDDQLQKCKIVIPINGTVLTKYAEQNEMALTGKSLYKIADLSTIILRVYISSNQLSQVKLNQKVKGGVSIIAEKP